ncbi:MAG: Zn-ribbon domain-containing OB-fold protein [Halioglobus sp.]
MNAPELSRILPPETEISLPFWDGCRSGELRMQHCDDCDRFQFYPRIFCTHCGGNKLSWRAVSGGGRIASYTVVRRGISSAYTAPYVVALIDLEEGPRMMSNVVDCDPDTVVVGAAVDVQFEPWGADYSLPVFALRTQT